MNEKDMYQMMVDAAMANEQIKKMIEENGLESVEDAVKFRAFYESHFKSNLHNVYHCLVPVFIEEIIGTDGLEETIATTASLISASMASGASLYRDWLSCFGVDIVGIEKQVLEKEKEGSNGLNI